MIPEILSELSGALSKEVLVIGCRFTVARVLASMLYMLV
jgi:hypothetical protein